MIFTIIIPVSGQKKRRKEKKETSCIPIIYNKTRQTALKQKSNQRCGVVVMVNQRSSSVDSQPLAYRERERDFKPIIILY